MYKLCIIGLSLIFILSISGVLSQFLCSRFEGSWLFIKDPTLQPRIFSSITGYDERKVKMFRTVESKVTPVTPFQAVWYPDFRYPAGGAFIPFSYYFVLKLDKFEGNELSLVDASVKATYMRQLGMLLCKKSDGKCGRDYRGQVSYVNDEDEIGIYIYPYDAVSVSVHYFINDRIVGNPVKLSLKSSKTLFPAVTFTKPGRVTIMECREEPPAHILSDVEFMAGTSPLISFNALMNYYKSKRPNDSKLFDFDKYENRWMFRDGFIVCKTYADQSQVPSLTESKDGGFPIDVTIAHRNAKEIRLDFIFYLVNSSATYIKRNLVKNTWSKFGVVMRTRMLGPRDLHALENWLKQFLYSANIVFLGPKGKSLHIADDKCAINLKYKFEI